MDQNPKRKDTLNLGRVFRPKKLHNLILNPFIDLKVTKSQNLTRDDMKLNCKQFMFLLAGVKNVSQTYKIGEMPTNMVLRVSNMHKDVPIYMLSDDDFQEVFTMVFEYLNVYC